jgi:hypothetical protein
MMMMMTAILSKERRRGELREEADDQFGKEERGGKLHPMLIIII